MVLCTAAYCAVTSQAHSHSSSAASSSSAFRPVNNQADRYVFGVRRSIALVSNGKYSASTNMAAQLQVRFITKQRQ
jgi:hypothetical protein